MNHLIQTNHVKCRTSSLYEAKCLTEAILFLQAVASHKKSLEQNKLLTMDKQLAFNFAIDATVK